MTERTNIFKVIPFLRARSHWLRNLILNSPTHIQQKLVDFLVNLGFLNIHRCAVHGPRERLHLGKGMGGCRHNAFFNTRSGHIFIGEGTVLSFNCMFLTGRHEFENGKLKQPRSRQVPDSGFDVHIGNGCWVASGAIVLGGVTVGDNCIIAAGAVVTHDVPDNSIVAGVPATVIGTVTELSSDHRSRRYGITQEKI